MIAMTALLTRRYIPESPVKTPAHVNYRAAGLMTLGISATLLAITETSTWGWGSPKTLGLLAAGLLLIGAWVREELRSREPLVDMRMMAIRGVWTTNTVAFLIGVGMYSSFILLPEFVQEPASTGYGFAASATAAGLFLLPATIAITVVGQFAGKLERRIGSRGALIAGALFALAAYALLVISRGAEVDIYVAAGLLGIGIGLSFAAMPNLIVENVRQEQTGVATGMNAVTRTLGGAFGGQVAATLLAGNLAASGLPDRPRLQLAFAMCLVALVAALGFAPGRAAPAPGREAPARDPATPRPEPAPSPSGWRRSDERDDGNADRGRVHRRPAPRGRLDGRAPTGAPDAGAPSARGVPEPALEMGLRDARRGRGAYADELAASIASAASM